MVQDRSGKWENSGRGKTGKKGVESQQLVKDGASSMVLPRQGQDYSEMSAGGQAGT